MQGDICDESLVNEIFTKYEIESVIHFAAESHVDNSIANPNAFIKTNVNGTFNLLHTAYLHWFEAPHIAKRGKENCVFHHISTDEVFDIWARVGILQNLHPMHQTPPIQLLRHQAICL